MQKSKGNVKKPLSYSEAIERTGIGRGLEENGLGESCAVGFISWRIGGAFLLTSGWGRDFSELLRSLDTHSVLWWDHYSGVLLKLGFLAGAEAKGW